LVRKVKGHRTMKSYWQFLIVAIICLLVAWLWAQPAGSHATGPQAVAVSLPGTPVQQSGSASPAAKAAATAKNNGKTSSSDDQPLPGSSSSLPLLAVIGFGVLAGGIISAMRTR
jgi:hypothetical protein